MKLVLIRHAQSIRNALFKGNHFYKDGQEKLGVPNQFLEITEKGRGQALLAAETLLKRLEDGADPPPAVLLHSGFTRTRETAAIIDNELRKKHDLPIEQNHLLRERDAGHAFEMHEHEVAKHFPYLEDYWKFEGQWFATPPGGESFIQVMDRVALFLSTLSSNEKYANSTIYAVTHGGTMRAFQMVVEKVPFDKADELVVNAKNCDIVSYEYTEGIWKTV